MLGLLNMQFLSYKQASSVEIKAFFTRVFSDSENPAEGRQVGQLAFDLITETPPQDLFGYIAIENNCLIGCILFSRLSFDSCVNAFILSPVAILTDEQGKGIGQTLINFGLEQLKKHHVKLVFTYGDPSFYSKVGFKHISENIIKAPHELSQPEGWLCLTLDGDEIKPISDIPRCVTALNNPELW